jgi:glycosyltransferase involved in cell wall biosynthesis
MISVIIATRDRARLLETTLDAVVRQECPAGTFEVIVVDNASVDDTAAVVASIEHRTRVPVVYLSETRPGKSHALNMAITRARGELLVFTDDDVLPSPGWLAAYVSAFEETDADFGAGRIVPLWEAPPPAWMSPALYGALAIPNGGNRRLRLAKGLNEHVMPIGANMAIRRHVIEHVGGWNPNLGKLEGTLRTGEDHEFALKMMHAGFTGVYEPSAWVQHRVPAERLRLAYFQRWFNNNGIIVAGLEEAYPTTARYVFNVPRYLWRQFGGDVLALSGAVVTCDRARAAGAGLRLGWFVGYLRGRWNRRTTTRRGGHAIAVPRV